MFYYDGTDWDSEMYPAYDVYQAVEAYDQDNSAVAFAFSSTSISVDVGGYEDIVQDYGLLTSVDNSSSFSVYVYDEINDLWVQTSNPLGWYRPFNDYANIVSFYGTTHSAGAANVAIVKGSTIPSLDSLMTIGLTYVSTSASYLYKFTLKDETSTITVPNGVMVRTYDSNEGRFVYEELTNTKLRAGIVVYGYGSDAYLALREVLGSSNVIAQENPWIVHSYQGQSGATVTYNTYYSWFDTVLGVGTQYVNNTYMYWASYDGVYDSTIMDYPYLSFSMGFYSHLSGAYNDCDEFRFIYE